MSENFEMIVVAKPGTNTWGRVVLESDIPPGYVKMSGLPPNNGDTVMVATEAGEWEIPAENYAKLYNEEIRLQRKAAYLRIAPIEAQLEALIEYYQGNDKKLQEISEKMLEVREQFQKI